MLFVMSETFTVLFPGLQCSVAWLMGENGEHRVPKRAERKL